MAIRIVIAGEAGCKLFAQACLVADYLAHNLPNFCFEIIEKSVLEWEPWLVKINGKHNWHHNMSPLIWKELLMHGSKPYYIGNFPKFLDYCYSYYQFDTFFSQSKFKELNANTDQFKIKDCSKSTNDLKSLHTQENLMSSKNTFSICISGAGHPLTIHIISGLLEKVGEMSIYKIFLYDNDCSAKFLEQVEFECSYIFNNNPNKVVKQIEKLGSALTVVDVLIIMNHVPFEENYSIGEWLKMNKKIMYLMANVINASANPTMRILIPNLGPACYNATVLWMHIKTRCRNYMAVATSDLGLEVASVAADIAEVPSKNLFCPPVWGFVGINHLVDINTTYHRYDSFEPYLRFVKVKNSTLTVGELVPEIRTMEYLMHADKKLWTVINEAKVKPKDNFIMPINKAISVINIVSLWLFDKNEKNIASLGCLCDGSFGLNFDGFFSQPAHLVDGKWIPAGNYMLPKDPYVKLPYLLDIAKLMMTYENNELPKIIPYVQCYCKPKLYKKKQVWI